MNKMRNWMVGLTVVALLAVGVVALAGNGFGGTAAASRTPFQANAGNAALCDQDADGDGIVNAEDSDWVRPLDGTGFGAQHGGGAGLRDGSCL